MQTITLIAVFALAGMAGYAWWKLMEVERRQSLKSMLSSEPLSRQEIMRFCAPIAKTVFAKQSKDCPIAESVLGATVAAMVLRSDPTHVAKFLRQCADSTERMGPNLMSEIERTRARLAGRNNG